MASPNLPVAERARRRILWRVLPFLFLIYMVNYLDRVNVSYAALEMTKDLGFTAAVFGFGAGIFFFGYLFLEIPGGIIAERWSARGWIARIMISWGIIAMLMGFITSARQFYVLRFLLGLAEAGFFPAMVVYLSHWFRYQDRAKTIAMFMCAIPVSNIIGAPVSGLLLDLRWLHAAGWRWLFILEGAPAVVLGVVTLFYLTDRPHQARWLRDDEREWITAELEREKRLRQDSHASSIWAAFRHRDVLLMTTGYFLIVTTGYGLAIWLPTIVKKLSGSSNVMVGLISALPYCFGLLAVALLGWSSDRTHERRWHTAAPMMLASVGFLISAFVQDRPILAVCALCVASAGTHGYQPGLWSLPSGFLSGSAAAAAVGLVNTLGSIGGFVGPYLLGYLNTRTSSFGSGLLLMSAVAMTGSFFILSLRPVRARVEAVPLMAE